MDLHRRAAAAAVALVTVTATMAAAAGSAQSVQPVPQDPWASSVVAYLGRPAVANPLASRQALRHPDRAPNGRSNLHDDAWQSDSYWVNGPLGVHPRTWSTFQGRECASVTIDSRGRLLSVCVGIDRPRLVMFDPRTLDTLATYDLPPRDPSTLPGLFTSFGGGGYFYLDNLDRAVIPTPNRHIVVVAEHGQGFRLVRDYDVSAAAGSSQIESALPDWFGNIWFVTESGVVGFVQPPTGRVVSLRLPGERIDNSFAVDETGGVFVVSDHALYRFDAVSGRVHTTWRQPYDRGTRRKPGQVSQGSGTTPTILHSGRSNYVAINDNADPRMHVLVYRADRSGPGPAPVCSAAVFPPGRSADENSFIAFGSSLIAENNYGYTGPVSRSPSASYRISPTTEPGVARIDIDFAADRCRVAWENDHVRVPTSVSKVSVTNGLLYVYSHPAAGEVHYRSAPPPTGPEDPWYLTAIDTRNGRVVWSQLVGAGLGYNNNWSPITLGSDGTAYIGVLGGLAAVRDTG